MRLGVRVESDEVQRVDSGLIAQSDAFRCGVVLGPKEAKAGVVPIEQENDDTVIADGDQLECSAWFEVLAEVVAGGYECPRVYWCRGQLDEFHWRFGW